MKVKRVLAGKTGQTIERLGHSGFCVAGFLFAGNSCSHGGAQNARAFSLVQRAEDLSRFGSVV